MEALGKWDAWQGILKIYSNKQEALMKDKDVESMMIFIVGWN